MWKGGVRVILIDEEERILMVCHNHDGKDIWMVPGGGIEVGENSIEAAKREMLEETGLLVEVGDLIWHVEEVTQERGQRFVNFFLAKPLAGEAKLGRDPEYDNGNQVLVRLEFMTKDQIMNLPRVYPEYLRNELWDIIKGSKRPKTYRIRSKDD